MRVGSVICLVLVAILSWPESGLTATATGVDSGAAKPNRLIHESSPYLRLHADNPVDWYPWAEEALERARRENKPIFLSVGYSTCYWCHVMERQVFSDPAIAELMNRWFISIKVDREERPDIDEIYMTATQLLTGHGGWPNSVFLTPDLRPFFAGTYFPPEDGNGRPGFPTVLKALHQAWADRQRDVESQAMRITEALREVLAAAGQGAGGRLPTDAAAAAVQSLKDRYDSTFGGFGSAPKFPAPSNLHLLWFEAERGDARAREIVLETLRSMGRGAIYDQVGGGFHRYNLDRAWRVPHFEKMLYDNALLAELLALTAARTGDVDLLRLARGTLDFLVGEMRRANGGFSSAIDAQTEGVEGAYYVWSREELLESLGPEEFRFLAPIMGFDGEPNIQGERHTLYLTASLTEHAERRGLSRGELLTRVEPLLARLRMHRAQRQHPLVDDKVLTDWNGMTIAALALAGRLLAEPRYIGAAERAGEFLLSLRDEQGHQLHVWRDGQAKVQALLDDYAYLIRGLIELAETTGQERWLTEAERLTVEMERQLREPRGGYFTSPADPTLLVRARTASDGAIPAGNGVAMINLLRLAQLTGRPIYRARADTAIRAFSTRLEQAPEALPTVALAVQLARDRAPGPTAQPAIAEQATGLAEEVVTAGVKLVDEPTSSDWIPFAVVLEIQDDWHVNANPASDELLVPTTVAGDVRSLVYPRGKAVRLEFADEQLRVYSGRTSIRGEVAAGTRSVNLTYQACDARRCLPPVSRNLPLPATSKPSPQSPVR